jgi:hypothetical protein
LFWGPVPIYFVFGSNPNDPSCRIDPRDNLRQKNKQEIQN